VINTLHYKIVDIANEKFWEISQRCNSNNDDNENDYQNSSSDLKQLCNYSKIESETYSIFKIGPIAVQRGRLFLTFIGLILYCLYLIIAVKKV